MKTSSPIQGNYFMKSVLSILAAIFALLAVAVVQAKEPFSEMDVFKIAYAANLVVSPHGGV